MVAPLVLCENIVKIYKIADLEVVALQGLDLVVTSGEMVAIMGASGSGKSTLLNVLSGLDVPNAGRCTVAGYDVTQLTPAQRLKYRRHVIGYVWQQSGRNLISHYTIAQNLTVPLLASGIDGAASRRRIQELLAGVGLSGSEGKYPNQLSGGEQQRIAVAVAIAHHPAVLLADEITGELDSTTARQIMELIRQLQQQFALTVILVTHDAEVAAMTDRVVALRNGRTSAETRRRTNAADALTLNDIDSLHGVVSADRAEYLVVDRVGRLQLPREVMDDLAISERVRIARTADHVELWPMQRKASTEQPPEGVAP